MPRAPGGPSAAATDAPTPSPGASPASSVPRGEVVTIAVLPAGTATSPPPPPSSASGRSPGHSNTTILHAPGVASLLAVKRLAAALKEGLGQYGPVLQLNSTNIGLLFPSAFEHLDVIFYRSKITSWLSSQEEEYRWVCWQAGGWIG